jgi:hypothetical protein
MKQTILVVGATGAQGGSVMKFLVEDGNFNVRCLVRSKETAQDKLGPYYDKVELVEGNLENVESLVAAMQGVYGVFGVTNFWAEDVGYEGEIRQGYNLADACNKAEIKHLIYSTLDRNSGVPHFESKVLVEDYIRKLGLPASFLVTSFYYENLLHWFKPKLDDSDTYVFSTPQEPETHVPMFSVSQTGGWVLQGFLHPERFMGADLQAVSCYVSYPELVDSFSLIMGVKARFDRSSPDAYGPELKANFKFFDDISNGLKTDRRVDLQTSDLIYNDSLDWEDYLMENKDAINLLF